MAFHTTVYDVYVALADPNIPALWNWEIWRRFLPAISPLILVARGKPAVRSTQYLPNHLAQLSLEGSDGRNRITRNGRTDLH